MTSAPRIWTTLLRAPRSIATHTLLDAALKAALLRRLKPGRGGPIDMPPDLGFASLRYPSLPLVSPPITDPIRTHSALLEGA